MIKNTKFLIILLVIFLNTNCSFDNKTGIWKNKEKERIAALKREQDESKETITILSSKDIILKEITAKKNISLSEPRKNLSWKMQGQNLQNYAGNLFLTGISDDFINKKIGKKKHKVFKINKSPLVFNQNIFFADDRGTIFSVNQKGKTNWKVNIYKKIYKKIYKNLSLSIHNEKLYVSDNIGFIYSLNIKNGSITWIKNHGIPLKSNIKIFDNKIFLINQDNRLLCLDVSDGSIIWDLRSISPFIKSQGVVSMAISEEGYLVMLSSSGDLIQIFAKNGSLNWSLNISDVLDYSGTDFFQSSDIVINRDEIIFSASSFIYSFDLVTASLKWRKKFKSQNTPIVIDDYIFLTSESGFFVNMDRKSGDTIWSTNILKVLKKKKQNTIVTGFILGSGKIYATTLNGYLIVCSASSGKVEYFKKIGDPVTSPPVISDGSLYLLTKNYRLIGFN